MASSSGGQIGIPKDTADPHKGPGVKFIILDDDELIYHTPLPLKEVLSLQELLRASNCFVPSFVGADAYSVATYITQYARYRTPTTFLFDRNLYSQVVTLAKGSRITPETCFAAAVMAFASCAAAQIEPNLAIYEGSASGAHPAWRRDLAIFRGADDIHPGNWAALALGYSTHFDRRIPGKRLRSEAFKDFDPNRKLRFYSFVYPIALKMAIISRAGGSPDKKMIELLDWIYHYWYFSHPAILLATYALSRTPPKNAFKNVRSPNREKALAGAKNAAWDLVYITEWFEKIRVQARTPELTVLCSRDRLLLKVAALLSSTVLGTPMSPFQHADFGKSVLERYNLYASDLSNPIRELKPLPTEMDDYTAKVIENLEAEFLEPL